MPIVINKKIEMLSNLPEPSEQVRWGVGIRAPLPGTGAHPSNLHSAPLHPRT